MQSIYYAHDTPYIHIYITYIYHIYTIYITSIPYTWHAWHYTHTIPHSYHTQTYIHIRTYIYIYRHIDTYHNICGQRKDELTSKITSKRVAPQFLHGAVAIEPLPVHLRREERPHLSGHSHISALMESCHPQNTTVVEGNRTVASGSMKDNPLLHYYISIYTLSMVVMLILKAIRGVVFVKVGCGAHLLLPRGLLSLVWMWHLLVHCEDGGALPRA